MVNKLRKLNFFILASQVEENIVKQIKEELKQELKLTHKHFKIGVAPNKKLIKVILSTDKNKVIFLIKLVENSFLVKCKIDGKINDKIIAKIENTMKSHDAKKIANVLNDYLQDIQDKYYEFCVPNKSPSKWQNVETKKNSYKYKKLGLV